MSNFTFSYNVFNSHLLLLCQNASAGGKGIIINPHVNHFSHTTNLQHTILTIYEKSLDMKLQLLNRVENIVLKGEVAHNYKQFLLFVTLFSKDIILLQGHQKALILYVRKE